MEKTKLTKLQKEEIKKEVDKQIAKEKISKSHYIKSQFKQHISTAVIAAFSFLMALSWRELISKTISDQIEILGLEGSGNLGLILTTLIITTISISGIVFISKWAGKHN